jgi:hypothetical protein
MIEKSATVTSAMPIFEFGVLNLFRDSVRAGLALFGFRILLLVSLGWPDESEKHG